MTAQPSDSGAAATKARTAEPLYGGSAGRRVTVRDLAAAKARGEKWPMLTAYDALTAGDRPYKKGLQRDEALDILSHERRAGRLDGALLDLFIEARIYEQGASSPGVTAPARHRRRPMR